MDNNKNNEPRKKSYPAEKDARHEANQQRVQDESGKRHGDKDENLNKLDENGRGRTSAEKTSSTDRYSPARPHESNAEYADPQDTNHDYLSQPQPMSDALESIYPGKHSTAEERKAQAAKRSEGGEETGGERNNLGQAGRDAFTHDRSNTGSSSQSSEREGGRSTSYGPSRGEDGPEEYEAHKTKAKDHFGKNQNRFDPENRDPDFPEERKNSWDDDATAPSGFGETDFDDRKARRRMDEGRKPWDSANSEDKEDYTDEYENAADSNSDRRER